MRSLEICVADIESAAAAVAGGADRLEVCSALEIGGLTPSAALVERVLRVARPAGVAVHAMVRPRAGDFAYDATTLELALAEGAALARTGCDGLVFGATAGGELDGEACLAWTARFSDRLGLTLHRAIDLVDDLPAAVDQAVAFGFDRILSSGGAVTAPDGIATLRAMVDRAAGRCRIVAGAGVRAGNVAALVGGSGVAGVHASASVEVAPADPALLSLGFVNGARRRTAAGEVRALRLALDIIST